MIGSATVIERVTVVVGIRHIKEESTDTRCTFNKLEMRIQWGRERSRKQFNEGRLST
jgi:hypothetical protein